MQALPSYTREPDQSDDLQPGQNRADRLFRPAHGFDPLQLLDAGIRAVPAPLTKIRFQPDGFISDTSPENIFFLEQGGPGEMWIAETPTHLRYEIQTGQPRGARP